MGPPLRICGRRFYRLGGALDRMAHRGGRLQIQQSINWGTAVLIGRSHDDLLMLAWTSIRSVREGDAQVVCAAYGRGNRYGHRGGPRRNDDGILRQEPSAFRCDGNWLSKWVVPGKTSARRDCYGVTDVKRGQGALLRAMISSTEFLSAEGPPPSSRELLSVVPAHLPTERHVGEVDCKSEVGTTGLRTEQSASNSNTTCSSPLKDRSGLADNHDDLWIEGISPARRIHPRPSDRPGDDV